MFRFRWITSPPDCEDAPDWPVLQVFCLDLSHLATGEVKDFLTEQLEYCHVVLTEAFTGSTGSHYVTDKGGPVFGPLLFQDLQKHFSFTIFLMALNNDSWEVYVQEKNLISLSMFFIFWWMEEFSSTISKVQQKWQKKVLVNSLLGMSTAAEKCSDLFSPALMESHLKSSPLFLPLKWFIQE